MPSPGCELRFHLTGFGPFAGVPLNPTQSLMQRIEQHVSANSRRTAAGKPELDLSPACVVETSTDGVKEFVSRIEADAHEPGVAHVWLHFGVASGAAAFQVETRANNLASFGRKDERGACLEGVCVEDAFPLGHKLYTRLNVRELTALLQDEGFPTLSSTSAGTFICNWLYWSSLRACDRLNATAAEATPVPQHASLFVHVPSFDVASLDTQLEFALTLMRAMRILHAAGALFMPAGSMGDGDNALDGAQAGSGGASSAARALSPEEAALAAALEASKSGDVSALQALAQRHADAAAAASVLPSGATAVPSVAPVAPSAAGSSSSPADVAAPSAQSSAAPSRADDDAFHTALTFLMDGGFTEAQSSDALRATCSARGEGPAAAAGYNVDLALEWLLSGGGSAPSASGASAAPASAGTDRAARLYKMVIVVREDLEMSKGKVGAQACHAALKAVRGLSKSASGQEVVNTWASQGEPIVLLRCADMEQLQHLCDHAQTLSLPACFIRDAGRTEVAKGSTTVLAIGPAPIPSVDKVTGHLKLL